MDLDTIMLKNISSVGSNYAGAESKTSIYNAVINLDIKTHIGRKLGELFIE